MLNFRNLITIFCVLFAPVWVTANDDDLMIIGMKLTHFQSSLTLLQNQGGLRDDKYANIWSDWPRTSIEFRKGVAKAFNSPIGRPTVESGRLAYNALDAVCLHLVNGLKQLVSDSSTYVNGLQRLYDTGKFINFLAFWGDVSKDIIEMEINRTRERNPVASRMAAQLKGILATYLARVSG